MGIFNTGAAVGARPLAADHRLAALRYGWRATFVITGGSASAGSCCGCSSIIRPSAILDDGGRARASLPADAAADASPTGPPLAAGWGELLRYRQVWAVVMARFVTDPIWWLYVFWLPSYFQEARGFSLQQVGWSAWFPFLAADGAHGRRLGLGLSDRRGWSVDRARKTVMTVGALLTPAGIFAVRAESPYVALALMGVVLLGFQVWVNNLQTLPSDFFPGARSARCSGSAARRAASRACSTTGTPRAWWTFRTRPCSWWLACWRRPAARAVRALGRVGRLPARASSARRSRCCMC